MTATALAGLCLASLVALIVILAASWAIETVTDWIELRLARPNGDDPGMWTTEDYDAIREGRVRR